MGDSDELPRKKVDIYLHIYVSACVKLHGEKMRTSVCVCVYTVQTIELGGKLLILTSER